MIITCPSCSTRFMLEDDQMPVTGRKVRCARCAHVWFEGASDSPAPAPARAPGGANPEIVQPDADVSSPVSPPVSSNSSAPGTPELENTASLQTGKSSKAVVWILVAVLVIGGAVGGVAYFMPKEFQALANFNKPKKPSVVTTKESWAGSRPQPASAPVVETVQPLPVSLIEAPAPPEQEIVAPAARQELPKIQPDVSVIFSDEPIDMGPAVQPANSAAPQTRQ
jgi:predicted Zn finger-like uncharacterized protein